MTTPRHDVHDVIREVDLSRGRSRGREWIEFVFGVAGSIANGLLTTGSVPS